MSIYPSSIPYMNPLTWEMRHKTLVTQFDELGEENRKQKWLYPKRDITLQYQAINKSDVETIYEFYNARHGSYGQFVFFESTNLGTYRSYTSEYVGTGDSTTLIFNLPAKDSSGSHTVYISGTSQPTSNYTFSAAGGSNGEDKITIVSTSASGPGPPSSSSRITYSFTGRLKVRCRFAEDQLSYQEMYDRLANTGLKLQGLLNS